MLIKNRNVLSQNMSEKGYTLIQMALALMVIGVLLAGFLGIYTQYQTEEKATKTVDRVNNALQAIQKYRNVYGSLPCPAPMNVNRTNATYGIASNYNRYLPAGTLPVVAGDCAEGICIEQNTRADLPGSPVLRVRVGAIPFRDMQLDESNTYDAYGSRLWYTVTEDMCNLTTFNETRGAINIVNDQGETQTTPANSAAFLIISPGINKIGGYGLEGILSVPCAGSLDSENCRDVSVATSAMTAATYRTQFVQDATLATSYDDVVEFFSSAQTQLWRRTAPGSENILDLANNVIGIGEATPTTTLDIGQSAISTLPVPGAPVAGTAYLGDIAPTNQVVANRQHGALRVSPTTSRLQADVYCSEGGVNCFRPENIAGPAGLNCPAGSYPTAITSNAITRNAEFTCAPISLNCPVGETFTGFTNVAGVLTPACSSATSFAACPAATRTLCAANDVILPAKAHDITSGTQWVYSGIKGSCRAHYYRCNNGNWEEAPAAWNWPRGSCVDTPVVTSGVSCGGANSCWTGTFTTTSTVCSGNSDTRASDCLCATCTRDITTNCSAPLTGTGTTRRYDYICPGPTPQTAAIVDPMNPGGTIIPPASTCSCSLNPYNTFFNCPAGYIRDAAAPALVPNNWPGDVNQGKYELVNVSGACTHVGSGSIIDHCSCNLADQYSTFQPVPANCKEPKTGSRNVAGTPYDWKFEVRKVTINPAGCTANPYTVEDAAQFQDINTYWREVAGSYSSTVNSKPAGVPEVGDACNCITNSPPGSTVATCIKASAAAGKWDSYQCRCDR